MSPLFDFDRASLFSGLKEVGLSLTSQVACDRKVVNIVDEDNR